MTHSRTQTEQLIRKLCMDVARAGSYNLTVKFTNHKKTYHQLRRDGSHLIVFGWECLEYWMTRGYREYPSLEYLVPKPRPIGLEAAWWITCHELAHMLQMTDQGNKRLRGSVHNQVFINCYELIRSLYPFSTWGHGDTERMPQDMITTFIPKPVITTQARVSHSQHTFTDLPTYAKDRKTFRSKVRDYLNGKGLSYTIQNGSYITNHQIISYNEANGAITIL